MNGIVQQSRIALGSKVLLTLVSKSQLGGEKTLAELWQYINQFETNFSRFLSDSELNMLNEAAGKWLQISDTLYDLLVSAQAVSGKTDGLFNPFILPALLKAGYSKSRTDDKKLTPPAYYNRQVVKYDSLKLKKSGISRLAKIPQNSAIDLGGCGKGYLLDKLSRITEANNVKNYWFSLGGDIIASGQQPNGEPWKIGIENANDPSATIAAFSLPAGEKMAVATSGTNKRRGVKDRKAWHHIIDPTTGQPAKTDILTATVCYKNGLEADVFASCLVVKGLKGFAGLAKKLQIKDYLIQPANPTKPPILSGSDIKLEASD